MDALAPWLASLEEALDRLGAAARALSDPDAPVTGDWSGRMVLAHVTFWHESFARNVADLAAGRRPEPLRGTYAVLGERARTELGNLEVEALLARIDAAEAVIARDTGSPAIGLIPYRHGSRAYGPAEHVRITADHVGKHAAELERAGRGETADRGSRIR